MRAVLQHYLSAEGIRMCGCMLKRSPGASAPMCRLPVHNAVSKGGPHVKWLLPLAKTWLLHASLAPVEQTLRLCA